MSIWLTNRESGAKVECETFDDIQGKPCPKCGKGELDYVGCPDEEYPDDMTFVRRETYFCDRCEFTFEAVGTYKLEGIGLEGARR